MQRTEIESLGEFGLIRRLTEQTVLRQPSSLLGIGDDAAVINPEGKRVVVSTDMLVEGVHFDLSYAPLKHLGYKAVAVNLSDICAMNAFPQCCNIHKCITPATYRASAANAHEYFGL